jgi:hypothetical protein
MAYLTDGKLGVDLTRVATSAEFTLGTTGEGNENSKWMYVYAASGISQYDAVMINQSSNAVPLTTTNAVSSNAVGFAQVAIASASYGWVATGGNNISCKLAANCAPNVRLYTTGTGGVLDDAIVSAGFVAGVNSIVTISNATAVGIIAAYPNVHNMSTT